MKIIISITIGAVIGYITNYIAIKMLFRPYREIKLFGIKMPFTPGLIPKERDRIAKSIGETIGTHLLSSETVADVLRSNRVNSEIKIWLKNRYNSLKTSDVKLEEILKKYLALNYEEVIQRIKNHSVNRLMTLLDDQSFEYFLKHNLKENIKRINISSIIEKASANEKFNKVIRSVVDDLIYNITFNDKKIKELLPEKTIDFIKNSVINNRDEIAIFLQSKFKSPQVRSRISKLINNIIQQNMGKLVSMFISQDFLTQKVISSLEDYLVKNENRMDLAIFINGFIDNISELEMNVIINRIDPNRELTKEISDAIVLKLKKKYTISSISNYLNQQIEDENFINFVFEGFQDLKKSQEFLKFVDVAIDKTFEIILNTKINVILGVVNDEDLEALFSAIKLGMDDIIKNNIEYFIDIIDIPTIVEDRINSFDVEFAEKIILEVANKELKSITLLGALLGGIIGIINPLLEIALK